MPTWFLCVISTVYDLRNSQINALYSRQSRLQFSDMKEVVLRITAVQDELIICVSTQVPSTAASSRYKSTKALADVSHATERGDALNRPISSLLLDCSVDSGLDRFHHITNHESVTRPCTVSTCPSSPASPRRLQQRQNPRSACRHTLVIDLIIHGFNA
jgi:hypothetical protein